MSNIVIIQARMGSSRLPGKIMLDLYGKPVLWHIINRLQYSEKIDDIIIATSINVENDEIREFCINHNINCYSGSEDDVLDRYYNAAKLIENYQNSNIIRITADCPLIDPEIVDEVIKMQNKNNLDYVSNTIETTLPDGLDCEVFKFSVLERAWNEATLKSEREHVTLYIVNNKNLFSIGSYKGDVDISSLRWTLDEKEDYIFIKKIYEKLYKENELFSTEDVLNIIQENPNFTEINSRFSRNEGLLKSLNNDLKIEEIDEECEKYD